MKKIVTLFQRNYDTDHLVRNEVTPGAEWVIAGEGIATVKWDGSCCLIRDGKLYKRYERKITPKNEHKPFPVGFEETEFDPVTQKVFGWVPVGDGPEDQYHREAFEHCKKEYANVNRELPFNVTYELLGPKINGNPEGCPNHQLRRHGSFKLPNCPRDYEGIKMYLYENNIEGIVWHHPDGRMVKIKGRDFGFRRGNK